ncbi:TPA: XRE family transcriptional regulator [Yersinia enterocolitica]|nr:XRE family transcriptional regulator [Yersinia enterocolitica]
MTFAERLNLAMAEGGFTQGSLAKAVGMAQSSVWKLTAGTARGSRKVVDIARVLNVNPEWLSSGDGPMRDGMVSSPSVDSNKIVTYKNVFSVDLYDGDTPTGDSLFVPSPVKSDTCRAYLLKVNSGCVEAPAGTFIVVDSKEQAGTNDLVYAKVNGVASVYRFVQGGDNGYLSVDDPRVPLIEIGEKSEFLGVIVFLLRALR